MDKFKDKYRIASARLQTWDYGNNGSYFITICTKDKAHYLGHIADDQMHLNELGQLAEQFWVDIPIHYPFIELGSFVVIPNHVHGIMIIDKPVETRFIASDLSKPKPPKPKGGFSGDKNPMFHDNISRILRWYKGRCSFEMHKIKYEFDWQERFHDHIIRNVESFEKIQNYIQNNPSNWKDDKFYS